MSKPEYKHICVQTPMIEAVETRTIKRQVGTKTVRRPRGFFSAETVETQQPVYDFVEEVNPTGQPSDVDPDTEGFGKMVEDACNDLHADGYDVISITPVLRGVHKHEYNSGSLKKGTGRGGWGYGYGYSLTAAYIIVGKLRNV